MVIYGKEMENLLLLIPTEWEVLVVVIRGPSVGLRKQVLL